MNGRNNNGNDMIMPNIDYGPEPFITNIKRYTINNQNFRTALWTGEYLQLTLMSIPVGGEIGLEVHPNDDQFLSIESGSGVAMMGPAENRLTYRSNVLPDYAIFIPAGTWHNLINTGARPLKLYSIYAPPAHPRGTIHMTKEESDASHYNEEQADG